MKHTASSPPLPPCLFTSMRRVALIDLQSAIHGRRSGFRDRPSVHIAATRQMELLSKPPCTARVFYSTNKRAGVGPR